MAPAQSKDESDNETVVRRSLMRLVVGNLLRGLVLGYAAETLPQLIGLLLPRSASKQQQNVFQMLFRIFFRKDAFPLAIFLGSMCAGYPLLKFVFGRAIGDTRHPAVAFAAGFIAFAAIFLDNAKHGIERRVTLALYLLVRAAECAGDSLVRRGILPNIEHMDTILFQLSCTEIMYSWFFTPHTLPAAYNTWITRMAQMDTTLLDYLRAFQRRELWYGKHSNILHDMSLRLGIPPEMGDPGNGFAPCAFVHPHDGYNCHHHSIRRFYISFIQAILIYLPVHTVPSLLFRFGVFRSDPVAFLVKNLLAASRSAAFLATFISSIYTCICLLRNRLQTETIWGPLLGSAACGFSLLIEKKSRRMELALYCVPRALYSIYLKLNEAGHVPHIKHFDLLLFALSGGALMYFAEHEPETIRPSIRSFMGWLFDLPRRPISAYDADLTLEKKNVDVSSASQQDISAATTTDQL